MRKLISYNFITLNGFYKDANNDIRWHKHDAEESAYGVDMLESANTLLFGRITYDMMKSYWPTPMALQQAPDMAAGMNRAEKIVFSRTLDSADWHNTRIIRDDMVDQIRQLKQQPGTDLTLLGSGSILTQFADHGLIDEYQIMLDPVAIGQGTPLFNDISRPLDLKLTMSRTFKSGVVLLHYQPV